MASTKITATVRDLDAAAHTRNTDFSNSPGLAEMPYLLILPTETRCAIYEQIIQFTGTVSMFSQYELFRNVDKPTIRLLHVCRLIRAEVQDYFYQNQTFEFRSAPAMTKFIHKIGAYHAGNIKKVELGDWFSRRSITEFLEQIDSEYGSLKALQYLTVPDPYMRYHGRIVGGRWLPGSKTVAILNASTTLAAGRVYARTDSGTFKSDFALVFVPEDCILPLEQEEFEWGLCNRIIQHRLMPAPDPETLRAFDTEELRTSSTADEMMGNDTEVIELSSDYCTDETSDDGSSDSEDD